MIETLDGRTLSFAAGVVALFCFMPLTLFIRGRRSYAGMSYWTVGTLANFIGLILISLRGMIPDFLSIVAANLLITSFPILTARGLAAFVGQRLSWWPDGMACLVLGAALTVFTAPLASVPARVVALCLVDVVFTARALVITWRGFPRLGIARNWLLVGTLGLACCWFLVRGGLTLFGVRGSAELLLGEALQNLALVLAIGATISIVAGFLIAYAQRKNHDLESAQKDVKNLSGLLPVCTNCRKIRDERGAWIPLESYVSSHSEASFSHGLCDECSRRLYPDLYDEPSRA